MIFYLVICPACYTWSPESNFNQVSSFMKTIFYVLAGLYLSVLTATAQTLNHPVIEKVQTMYKPDQSVGAINQPSSSPEIKVHATVTVHLKSNYDAVRIYLKIRDQQTQATLYDVNYQVSSSDVSDQGVLLYKKQGTILSITNPAAMSLRPYVYELYTVDAGGSKSNVYTIIQ